MIKELIAEGLGTFFFVFSIGVSRGEPFAVGGTLWTAMVFTGFISGGQFNPAITFAILLRKLYMKRLSPPVLIHLVFNMLVQIVCSILAALVAWGIVRYPVYFDISDGYGVGEGFLAEMIYTAIICAVALMVGQISESIVFAGGVIALAVTASDWSVGRITGGCFNPAVAIGVNFIYYAKNGGHFAILWLYILAPLLGAVIGTGLACLFLDEVEAQKHEINNPSLNRSVTQPLNT
jgi:aquaporin Z